MPEMDREILLEALSALTNQKVSFNTKHTHTQETATDLTVYNFVEVLLETYSSTLLGSLTQWMKDLMVNDDVSQSSELFVDVENFLDPQYDYDFRNFTGSTACARGGESYRRPVGWYRFALKVKDKYPDGNAWLGNEGWRSQSEAGEWPVSFHGTSLKAAKEIASSHYRAGPRAAYGHGIYSTPDIKIAEDYAMSKKFISKNGNTYEVIMQNRINPQHRKIIREKNFWLIPVPEGSTAEQEKELVQKSIRPYGILIKQLTQ